MQSNVEVREDQAGAAVPTPNTGGLVDAPECGHPVLRSLGEPAHAYWCETCGSPFAPFEVVRVSS